MKHLACIFLISLLAGCGSHSVTTTPAAPVAVPPAVATPPTPAPPDFSGDIFANAQPTPYEVRCYSDTARIPCKDSPNGLNPIWLVVDSTLYSGTVDIDNISLAFRGQARLVCAAYVSSKQCLSDSAQVTVITVNALWRAQSSGAPIAILLDSADKSPFTDPASITPDVRAFHSSYNGGGIGRFNYIPYAEAYADRLAAINMPISYGLGHELAEMVATWGYEVADPVVPDDFTAQAGFVLINNYRLSNFILPAWAVQGSLGPWDYLGVLESPGTATKNGYIPKAPF